MGMNNLNCLKKKEGKKFNRVENLRGLSLHHKIMVVPVLSPGK